MDLREFFRNKSVIQTAVSMAERVPPWAGYGLARFVARQIVRRKPAVYWQVRENLSHVVGEEELDVLTKQAFVNAGYNYYDYYHVVRAPIQVIVDRVDIPEEFFSSIKAIQEGGRGVMLVGVHMSNFDLGAMAVAANGLTIQALSLADPPEGFELMNRLRVECGFYVTPISVESLRKAYRNLKKGNLVTTAIDWPQPEEGTLVEAFGKLAHVPLGPARLAMMAKAPIIVLAFYSKGKGQYGMYFSEPVEMERTGDKEADVLVNTKRLVKYFEEFVSRHPEQWMMFYPFWEKDERNQENEVEG